MSEKPDPDLSPYGELFLGLDIGSGNVRVALVDSSNRLVYCDSERIYTGPSASAKAIIDRLQGSISLDRIAGAGATGSGRRIYTGQDGWQIFSSPYAAIAGVVWDQPDPKTIICIGGQSSMVIGVEDGLKKYRRLARSPLCAAGTGRFLEQQASRLGVTVEEF